MDFLKSFIEPHNLIFTIPLLIMMVNVILQIAGMGLDNLLGGAEGLSTGVFGSFFSFFNAADASVMLVVQLLLVLFGLTGPILNYFVLGKIDFFSPGGRLLIASPLSAVVAVAGTKVVTILIASYFPSKNAFDGNALKGQPATVVSKTVDREFGRAKVALPSGEHQIVFCRMAPGEPHAAKNDRLTITSYDASADCFECRPSSAE